MTDEQWKAASSESSKIVIAAGEGAGKSHTAAVYATAHAAWDLQRLGMAKDGLPVARLYWIVGQDYVDAYREFELILAFNRQLKNVDETSVHIRDEGRDKCSFKTITGQLFVTMTAADPTSLGREEPHGLIGCEVSRWQSEVWTRCFGRLARQYQDNSWGIFSGSFETSIGPFSDWYKVGQGPNDLGITSYNMPTWSNTYKFPGGIDDPEIERQRQMLPAHRFLERFGGLPAPPQNAVLPDFSITRHVDETVKYDVDSPVYLAIDPGDKTYAVLFVQIINGEVWVMDEVYVEHWNHQSVIDECKLRPGWKYAQLWKRGAIDIAGTQHHAAASPLEIWEDNTGFVLGTNKIEVEKSVERLQSVLAVSPSTGRPRLRIHPRCKGILSELGGGPPPIAGGGVWVRSGKAGRPERANDHACKALAYLLIELFGTAMPEGAYIPEKIDLGRYVAPSYLSWSFSA